MSSALLDDSEGEVLPVTRPRSWHMRFALFWFREAFDRTGAAGLLCEERQIAFAIRLEHDPMAVGRPDGKAVLTLEWERQPPNRTRRGHVVDPDDGFLTVVAAEDQLFPVPRSTN